MTEKPEAMIEIFVRQLNAKLADEYQAQKAEIGRLRAALQKIATGFMPNADYSILATRLQRIAKDAIANEQTALPKVNSEGLRLAAKEGHERVSSVTRVKKDR